MRSKIGLAVLLGLLTFLGFEAWPLISGGKRLGAKPAALETAWKTEEQWLADLVVRDLVEMAALRSGRPVAPYPEVKLLASAGADASFAFSVALPDGAVLRLEPDRSAFVWSPDEYEGLARQLLAVLVSDEAAVDAGVGAGGGISVAAALTNPEPEVIERANQQVSVALGRSMRDPAAHESAALVLESLGLREAAASYSDVRTALCRATAHLAFAAALRGGGPRTTDGRLALVAHLALAGRGADAAVALKEMEGSSALPGVGAWTRAMRLRLFEDTRGIDVPETLLERRELYRAGLRTVDPGRALESAERLELSSLTDAWRAAAEVVMSVETGNAFMPVALEQELEEARAVYSLSEGGTLSESRLGEELSRPAERLLTPRGPRVLGRGTWAAYHQRHVVAALYRRNYHLRAMLGLYAEADAHREEVAARFGSLSLGPLLTVRLALDATKGPGPLDTLIGLAAQRPELMPAGHWFAIEQVAAYEVVRQGMPEARKWFVPGVPRGTAFDVTQRGLAGLLPRDTEEMRRLHALSPADFETTRALLGALYRDKVPSAEISRFHGSRSLYDIRVLEGLVAESWGQPKALGPLLDRTCQLLPDRCFDYGFHLVTQGQDGAAAQAYRRGFDGAADRVLASHNVRWLVLHYLKEKRNSDAFEVAQKAAEVGSGGGLRTLSRYLEYTSDFEGAERLLQSVRERYGREPKTPEDLAEAKDGEQDEDDHLTFYYRMAFVRLAKSYEEKFWQLARDDFPRGLEKLERASLSGRPEEGVMLLTVSDQGTAAGVRQGDIVVGLNGHRIRSRRQYFLVLDFTDEPAFVLDVFRHPAYLQISARSPDRTLGLSLRTLGR